MTRGDWKKWRLHDVAVDVVDNNIDLVDNGNKITNTIIKWTSTSISSSLGTCIILLLQEFYGMISLIILGGKANLEVSHEIAPLLDSFWLLDKLIKSGQQITIFDSWNSFLDLYQNSGIWQDPVLFSDGSRKRNFSLPSWKMRRNSIFHLIFGRKSPLLVLLQNTNLSQIVIYSELILSRLILFLT